jgi:tRNA(fMet)-specific endonuclease VapC
MIRYLLDTNIVIYVFKKRPIEVLWESKKNSGRMAISSITLAELFHGAEKKRPVSKTKKRRYKQPPCTNCD